MHPCHHALTSVKLWGGIPADYQAIHDWFDATKETFGDARHRGLRHHTQGIFEAERVFGHTITNSAGRKVPVRYIGEQHVREDCGGRIPTVADWFRNIRMEPWMNRGYRMEPDDPMPDQGSTSQGSTSQGSTSQGSTSQGTCAAPESLQ